MLIASLRSRDRRARRGALDDHLDTPDGLSAPDRSARPGDGHPALEAAGR